MVFVRPWQADTNVNSEDAETLAVPSVSRPA